MYIYKKLSKYGYSLSVWTLNILSSTEYRPNGFANNCIIYIDVSHSISTFLKKLVCII